MKSLKKENPLVSIVIPCYNHTQFVQETIQSVIDQDHDNIELIIIDDGSKDNSVDVIKEMIPACENRFTRFEFRSRPNKGLAATLNEAIEWCKGEFFAAIASDDILKPYKTRVQVDYLLKNTLSSGVFGGVEIIYHDTSLCKLIVKQAQKYNFEKIFLHQHTLPAPTQLLRLESIERAGGYRENLLIEDWSMWLLLTKNGNTLDYIDIVFSGYRRHQDNLSSQFDKMQQSRLEVTKIFITHPLYKEALARTYMAEALDWQKVNFKKSISSVKKAFSIDASILYSIVFIKYLMKFLL